MNALRPEVLAVLEGREAQLMSHHLRGGGPLSPLTGPTGGRIQRSLGEPVPPRPPVLQLLQEVIICDIHPHPSSQSLLPSPPLSLLPHLAPPSDMSTPEMVSSPMGCAHVSESLGKGPEAPLLLTDRKMYLWPLLPWLLNHRRARATRLHTDPIRSLLDS